METDTRHQIWSERGEVTWKTLVSVLLLSMLPWLVDIATDLKVTVDHYRAGDNFWFTLSLLLIVVPSAMTQVVSFLFHKDDDQKKEDEHKRRTRSQWIGLGIIHVFQLGVLKRYIDFVRFGYLLRYLEGLDTTPQTAFYESVVSQRNDLTTIGLFTAFLEDAPQLVLQLYILVSRGGFDVTSLRDISVVISTCVSLVSFSLAVTNFVKWQKAVKENSAQIPLYSELVIMGWRLCLLVARMIALILFASVFKGWLILFMFLHGILMFLLCLGQKMDLFPTSARKQLYIRLMMAYVSIFCYFSIKEKNTRSWVITFNTIVFVENSSLFLLSYYYYSGYHDDLWKILLATEWGSFALGLMFMIAYYGWLHPNLIGPSTDSYPGPVSNVTDAGQEKGKKLLHESSV